MSNLFNSVKVNRPKSNKFDLSHERKFSMQMGNLVPVMCQEVVPGDKFQHQTQIFMRLAPMLAPIMHRVNVYTHFFFVPNRLVFNDWEEFITGGVDGRQLPVFPTIPLNSVTAPYLTLGSLADYLSLPVQELKSIITSSGATVGNVNALPFRAYQLIFNEYYRDQNLMPELEFSRDSDTDSDIQTLMTLRKRCWEKDYFTSALPWSQRGADVLLPLHGSAGVKFTPNGQSSKVFQPSGAVFPGLASGSTSNIKVDLDGGVGSVLQLRTDDINAIPSVISQYPIGAAIDNSGQLAVDLAGATQTTINDFRRSMKLQLWLERNARAGSRYIEQIASHFGVRSSDARLQRPEYLGGGKSPVVISEVLQTSATDDTTPQGNMAGHGISVGLTHGFRRFFEEHGFVIGIMSVLPRTAYQQGIPRVMNKVDKYDYYFPEFAHLGEQAIRNDELYPTSSPATNAATFGYTPRYAEYKYIPSSVHGDFKDTLQFWHMGRKFAGLPGLNAEFVTSDPTQDIFAVTDPSVDKLYVQIFNNLIARRLMPKFGTPSF